MSPGRLIGLLHCTVASQKRATRVAKVVAIRVQIRSVITVKSKAILRPIAGKKHPEKKPDWASKGKRGGKKGVKEDDSGKDDSDLAVVALSVAKPGLDKHSWCFDGGAASHITHTRENLDCYTPNDGSLPTVLTANGPVKPLGSGTVWLEVDGVGGKPLKLELKDVLHLSSVPVNLFSGQLFEKRTAGGYLKKGTLYNGRDEPLAQIESTGSGHFLKIVKEPRFALLARSIKSKPVP